MILLFWFCLSVILFSLFGYGLLWIVLAGLMPRRPTPAPIPQSATVLIAARNEAADIAAKLDSILSQDTGPHSIDILVVSDGSDDATVEIAAHALAAMDRGEVIDRKGHSGKAPALNTGLSRIGPDRIVIFSDANSILGEDALRRLLDPFAAPEVGGTIGQLDIPDQGSLMAKAERLFWHYDNALKRAEDRIGGVVSAQGTLYAVRRALVPHIPPDMADDLFVSLAVVDQGKRLRFAPGAVARETVTGKLSREFGRRVRSTERGWRGLMHFRRLLNPWRTGIYAAQLFCHKVLRRLVAFLLPVLFLANVAIWDVDQVYTATLLVQVVIYGTALFAASSRIGRRLPGASAALMFTFGHAAMAVAILRYFAGIRSARWSPVRNEDPGAGRQESTAKAD